MDCHLSLVIYNLVASCLHLPYSLSTGEHSGECTCQSVKITSPLCREDLDPGLTLAHSNLALFKCFIQV